MPHVCSPSHAGRTFHALRRGTSLAVCAGVSLLAATVLFAQQTPKIPTVNANVGGCTADFVIQNGNHKPLYSARISVEFHYGLFGMHKASLEAYTDSKGQARFEGLPDAPKKPLDFHIHFGDRQKTVTDNPGNVCNENFTVVLP